MKTNSTWNDIIKPVVVLTVICTVVAGLLGLANNVTAPIIAQNAALVADAARIELLPEATEGFDPVEVDIKGVEEMYKAKNDVGYTVTSFANGYGGPIKFMIAYDNDGKIINLKVLELSETPGIGDKILTGGFLEQFIGKDTELTSSDVDLISGSTISSSASLEAVNIATRAFNEVAKGIVVVEKTFEEKLGELFGEGTPAAVITTDYTHEDAVEFWQTEKGIIVVAGGKGYGQSEYGNGPILAYVAFNEDGTIAGLLFDDSTETKGLGTKINEPDYIANFIGKDTTDGVDLIANVTYSSKGAIEAVNKAIDVFASIN